MCMLSWSLEFMNNVFLGIMSFSELFVIDSKGTDWRILFLFEVFFHSVLIPSSYLLRTDTIKEIVVTSGWKKPLVDLSSYFFELLLSEYLSCCNTKVGPSYQETVGPMDEIGMDVIPTAEPVRNAIPLPIPTISGTIEEDIIIDEL